MKLIIGSRGSHLALVQSRYVERAISTLSSAPETEIKIIKTAGDRILNLPLSEITGTADERKGLFTGEIEEALITRKIDIAVHSLKDLPTINNSGLIICAIPERISARDVLVFHKSKRKRDNLPYLVAGARIGTSSVRRIAQIKYLWPEMKCINLRGNLTTRLKKLQAGNVKGMDESLDAIMIAEAGLLRLKRGGIFNSAEFSNLLQDLEIFPLPCEFFVSAPAQGALALQCRADDDKIIELIRPLHRKDTAFGVEAEREILSQMEGGCNLPLGVNCRQEKSGFEINLFLGQDAVQNRRGRSFRIKRAHRNAGVLARYVFEEISETPVIVLTGRKDRITELKQKYSKPHVIALPLIEIEYLQPGSIEEKRLLEWLGKGIDNTIEKRKKIIAVFSVPGVEAFHRLLAKKNLSLIDVNWAVTGKRTSAAVKKYFPGATIICNSPNGTGKSLGDELIKKRRVIFSPVLVISAKGGRKEFQETLAGENIRVDRLDLYQTKACAVDLKEIENLPVRSHIFFGSPSAVKEFFKVDAQVSRNSKDKKYRYCALGPTTADAIEELGYSVYAVPDNTDYETFIEDFI